MKVYEGRTSGVLLESIFVGTIPIAPKRLLEENEVRGIGYETLDEINAIWLKSGKSRFPNTRYIFLNKEQLKTKIYDFL